MSLRPIDLQTMLVRLSELSREQAAIHDGAVQSKAAAMADSIKKAREADAKVDSTQVVPDQVPQVDDHTGPQEKDAERHPQTAAACEESDSYDQPDADKDEIFRDPNLGGHIDISG